MTQAELPESVGVTASRARSNSVENWVRNASSCRRSGASWAEIAATFSRMVAVSARAASRYASASLAA